MIAFHAWPANVFYGKEEEGPIEYQCCSFLGGRNRFHMDFYRLIVRVKDGAYKIFKERAAPQGEPLYFDATLKHRTEIYLPEMIWKFPRPGQKAIQPARVVDKLK